MANSNHFTSDSFEEKFNSLFHSLAHGIVYQDRDGRIISANPAALDILGLTDDEIMGRTSMNPEWRSMKEDGTPLEGKNHPAMVALRTGEPVKGAIMGVFHPVKHSVRWISIDAHPEFMKGESEPFRVFAVFTDITEKFEAVQKLRESSDRLQRYFDTVPVGFFVVDQNGYYVDVNPTGCALYEGSREEIVGTHLSNYIAEESMQKGLDSFRILSEIGEYSDEMILQTLKGNKFPAILSAIKLSDTEYIGYVTDISDFVKAQEELKVARNKAEESNRIKTNILSNMSHELRTPIHGILGLSEMIFDESEEPFIQETARKLIVAGSRLMNTFNLILDVSIQDAKEITEGYSEFDLVELVRNTGEEFRGLAQEKGIAYTISLPDGSMRSTLPHASVETALKCLLDNAIKYTFQGSVDLRLCVPSEGERNIRIEVEDTGIGIAGEHHEMIFEDFRQVSEGHGRSFEGTGLGLTVVNKIVRNLGGDIKVESLPGEGSLFAIELPIAILDPSVREELYKGGSAELIEEGDETSGKPKILVLEKDQMSANILKVSIRDNYSVRLASDETAALQMLTTERFDLVLMSVSQEDREENVNFVHSIKALPSYPGIPVIAMTTPTPGQFVADKSAALFDGFLMKPFFRKNLVTAIDTLLNRTEE